MLSLRCSSFLPLLTSFKQCYARIVTSAVLANEVSLYEVLGLSPNSTQAEIKSAYYKLSMQYHPDKNQGCEESLKKFQMINHAYEILSNYSARRLYDKGATPTFSTFTQDISQVVPEDDDETKFYKSRMHKSIIPDELGRRPVYDFDVWSRLQTEKSFLRRKAAKAKFERKTKENHDGILAAQNELLLLLIAIGSVVLYVFLSEKKPAKGTQNNATKRKS